MKQPMTLANSGWTNTWVELLVLFALITGAAVHLFDMHWLIAMTVAPVVMLGLLLLVVVTVEALWLLVTSLDRLGAACGLRKSPLA